MRKQQETASLSLSNSENICLPAPFESHYLVCYYFFVFNPHKETTFCVFKEGYAFNFGILGDILYDKGRLGVPPLNAKCISCYCTVAVVSYLTDR